MNLREAAEQALEALEDSHQNINPERRYADELTRQIADAITSLRAALAEDRSGDTGKTSDHFPDAGKMVATIRPEVTVEPVAWATVGFVTWGNRQIEKVDKLTREAQPEYGFVIPLYTAPPKREPLTDDDIEALRQGEQRLNFVTLREFRVIARAIERAHGIGGEE